MNAADVMQLLDQVAPRDLAEPWDNVGFQVGDRERPVEKVLIALDLEMDVIEEAVACGAQMIITHHPLIFRPMQAVTADTREGQLVMALIAHKLAFACAHTNLDKTMVSLAMAEKLGLKQVTQDGENPFMVLGSLPEAMPAEDFIAQVKAAFDAPMARGCGAFPETIRHVAVIGGAGGDMLSDAAGAGADVLVTGEIKYHEAQQAAVCGVAGLEIGHDVSERTVLKPLALALQNRADALQCKVEFICAQVDTGPYTVLR